MHTLYQEVRMFRENGMNAVKLSGIWHAVKQYYPGEWLLPLELAELLKADEDSAEVLNDIFQHLEKKKSESD